MTHDTTNRLTIFNLLVEKGANINQISKGGGSVLGYACEGNQIEIVKLLLAKGVDVDARKNNFANTPLMYAANGGYEEAPFLSVFQKYCKSSKLINTKAMMESDSIELSYHIVLKDQKFITEFINQLKNSKGVNNVNLFFDEEYF